MAPCCYDFPPQYDSSQPSQDLLTSVIENVQTARKLLQRVDDLDKEVVDIAENFKNNPMRDWNLIVEFYYELGQKGTEMTQLCTGLAKNAKTAPLITPTSYIKLC